MENAYVLTFTALIYLLKIIVVRQGPWLGAKIRRIWNLHALEGL